MNSEYFHGSNTQIAQITDSGVFGGIFAATDEDAALSHGNVLHSITSPRPLSNYALNYEIDGAFDMALEVCGGNEEQADAIMSASCPCDSTDAEDGWELQRLRGVLASRLGYTSIEMRDEHGTTWLCLPGCRISKL